MEEAAVLSWQKLEGLTEPGPYHRLVSTRPVAQQVPLLFQLRDGIVTSDDSGTLLAGQWGEGADRIRAEKARQAWRTDSTQLKVRSILQGGKRYTDLAELEPVHTATLVDVLANERQSGRRMFKASSADDKAGWPCSTPIEELCPIEISALRPGEVHTGTVLWVEVVGGSRNVLPNQTLELVPAVISTRPEPHINRLLQSAGWDYDRQRSWWGVLHLFAVQLL